MNTRSIRFKLIAWYAGLLVAVMAGFGAYTYARLNHYLASVLVQTLSSRARRIGGISLVDLKQMGEAQVAGEIESLYAPELNDRFIRITRPDGSTLYVSGIPNDKSFDPMKVPPGARGKGSPAVRREATENGSALLIVAVPFSAGHQNYLIEVGASEAANNKVLHDFLFTLVVGLPVVLGLAIFGGGILIKQALAPVQKIMGAAQEITLHHLDMRLPVVHTGDEIEKLSNALNQMIGRLERSFQASSRFTADASHELRTPLTIMQGELEAVLLNDHLPLELHQTLDSFLEETARLSKIVTGLLSLSRLDAGEAQMERVKLDLAELVASTAEQMSLLAVEKEIEVSCEAKAPVQVAGDRSRLKQVVVNLLDNAIKYTPRNGRISLSVTADHANARLQVADSGPGIPEKALPHVFERFFRTDEVRSRSVEGTGLGLSIVKLICAAHGGAITVECPSGGGCRFTVEIPLASRS